MLAARRRSILVGLVSGLIVSVVVALALTSDDGGGDDGAVIGETGTSGAAGIPTAPELDGEPLPTLELTTLSGDPVFVGGPTDRPMVVNIWASTCKPCVEEMPDFEAVHREVSDRVRFVGLNNQDLLEAATEFAEKTGVTYELWADPRGEFVSDLGVAVLPTTLFVSTSGDIVRTETGAMTAAELRVMLQELFGA